MLDYTFYPFKNELENLDGSDLLLLRDISEGWYIDYKKQNIKSIDYAKHMSGFANQYGGWLIIGVTENKDGSRTAYEFPGIEAQEVSKITLGLREAASAHVNPSVLYEEKVINGPIEEINLQEERSIIVIGIPKSFNTPHIHSSGRIYRRLADQSDPKAETDRYILDELWKRGFEYKQKVIKRLTEIPELPAFQSNSTWAHIFFTPSESQLPSSKKLSFEEFVRIMTNSDNTVSGLHAPLTAASSATYGYVARQIKGNDPSLSTLTFRWWHDGSVRLDVPINQYDLNGFLEAHKNSTNAPEFCRIAIENGFKNMKILDYSIFFKVVVALSNCYLKILEVTGDTRDVYSCFTLRNLFQSSPFLDNPGFIERIKKYSLPLTIDNTMVFPNEPTEDNMIFHKLRDESLNQSTEHKMALPYTFSYLLCNWIFNCVGLFSDHKSFINEIGSYHFD